MKMADPVLRHKVENSVASANVQTRLDAVADMREGWVFLHAVWTGTAFTLIWQRRTFE